MSSNVPPSNDPADLSFGGGGNDDNPRPETLAETPSLGGGTGFPPTATEVAAAHIARGIQSGALGQFGTLFDGMLGNRTDGAPQQQESRSEMPLEAGKANPPQGPHQSSGGITGVSLGHPTQGATGNSNVLPVGGGGITAATVQTSVPPATNPPGTPTTSNLSGAPPATLPSAPGKNLETLRAFALSQAPNAAPEHVITQGITAYKSSQKAHVNLKAFKEIFKRPVFRDGKMAPGNVAGLLIYEGETTHSVLHALGVCTLDATNTHNPCDNGIYGFLGDRTPLTLPDGGEHMQDPPAVSTDLDKLLHEWKKTKMVPHKTMDAADPNETFIDPTRGSSIALPIMLVLPWAWVPCFLDEPRTPVEAYKWVKKETQAWTEPDAISAKELFLSWFRGTAAAQPTTDPGKLEGALTATWNPVALPNKPFSTWAFAHLNSIYPRNTKPTLPAAPSGGYAAPRVVTPDTTNAALTQTLATLLDRMSQREENALRRELNPPANRAKEIPPVQLHKLLGWAGLGIDTQTQLPPIWKTLAQQPSKDCKHTVLATAFSQLGQTNSGFTHFNNKSLMDNIISYTLAPGFTTATMHHGASPLAFIPRSAEENQRIEQQTTNYEQATVRTPADVAKHSSTKAPDVPTGFMDMTQVFEMMEDFLLFFLGMFCDLWVNLRSLREGLAALQPRVLGNSRILQHLTPQAFWLVITDARQFFNQMKTQSDMSAPGTPHQAHPNRAVSHLNMSAIQTPGVLELGRKAHVQFGTPLRLDRRDLGYTLHVQPKEWHQGEPH